MYIYICWLIQDRLNYKYTHTPLLDTLSSPMHMCIHFEKIPLDLYRFIHLNIYTHLPIDPLLQSHLPHLFERRFERGRFSRSQWSWFPIPTCRRHRRWNIFGRSIGRSVFFGGWKGEFFRVFKGGMVLLKGRGCSWGTPKDSVWEDWGTLGNIRED